MKTTQKYVCRVELVETVQKIADERLTAKQKAIMKYVSVMVDEIAITKLVRRLMKMLACSETAVWNNVNQLRRIGVLEYGNVHTKGMPVRVTEVGRIVCENVMEVHENGIIQKNRTST
jgi:Fe2+ or Zn2+ uptake regulation protein